jgi:AraC family transcriptional regulator
MLHPEQNRTYRGNCLRRRHVAGLVISERVYPAGLDIPPHTHEHPFLCAVLQGASSEVSGGKLWDCSPGTVLVRPAGLTHANRVGAKGLRFVVIELAPDWSARGDWQPMLPQGAATVPGVCAGLNRKLHRELHSDDAASALVLEGLVLEILGEACRAVSNAERGHPRWLRRARETLHARFRQPPGLAELSGAVGVHPFHLARVFRRAFSCSPGEYVRRLRIDFACRALADPRRSLVGIALDAGFADQSQFCRTFKKLLGVTPSQFRRETRGR